MIASLFISTSDCRESRLQGLRGCVFHGLHRSGQLGVGVSGDSSLAAGEIRAVQSLHEFRLFRGQKRNGVLEPVGRVLSAPRLLVAAGAFGVAAPPHHEDQATVFGRSLNLQLRQVPLLVELVHRNQELDDLYDEYDIPFEDEEEKPAVQKKSRSQFAVRSEEAKPEAESPEEEEEILAADGGEYYDDDDGYYDEDEYYDEEDDYYDDDDDELDDYYDDEADDDEIDDDFSGDTADIGKRENSSDEEDDNFKVDFIDL